MRLSPDRQAWKSAGVRTDAYNPSGMLLRQGRAVPLGGLLVATVDPGKAHAAADSVVALRRRAPWTPLILVVPGVDAQELKAAATLSDRTPARVLDFEPRPFPEWRSALWDTAPLAEEFLALLRMQRPDLRRRGRTLGGWR